MGCDTLLLIEKLLKPNFNPRTPHGVRRGLIVIIRPIEEFQSTHPAWGATCRRFLPLLRTYFNPRTPHGVRLQEKVKNSTQYRFQSTHPAWGATLLDWRQYLRVPISIHAPRMGCDLRLRCNPRPGLISIHAPRMGCDIHRICGAADRLAISIHAPRMGCDRVYQGRG